MFKRTEGVSTTDITGRLLALAERVVKDNENLVSGDKLDITPKTLSEDSMTYEETNTARIENPPLQ